MRTVRPAPHAVRSIALLAPVLLVAVAVSRVGAPSHLYGDEGPILGYAGRLLDGHYAAPGTRISTDYLWHGPGLPFVLAPLLALRVPLAELRLAGPVALFASAVVFHRLLLRCTSERRALAGAYALGLYLPFAYVLPSLHKEPLALLCVTSALYAQVRFEQTRLRRFAIGGGLALAALVMVRLEYGWVVLVLAVLASGWRLAGGRGPLARAAGTYGVALAGCCPWLLYTLHVTGRPLYWGSSGGLSLFWTAAPGAPKLGQWHAVHSVLGPGADPGLVAFRPLFASLERLSPLARDLAFQHIAAHQAAEHPRHFALGVLANASRLLFAVPMAHGPGRAALVALVASTTALLALAARAAIRGGWRPDLPVAPFALLLAAGVAVHLVPASEPRMLFPLVPLCLWFGVCHGPRARRALMIRSGARARTR